MRRLAIVGMGLLASCTLALGQDSDAKKTPDKKKAEPVNMVQSAASIKAKEEIILDRRNQVILKFREIAERTHDDALMRKADELYERAFALYLQRTSGIPAREEQTALETPAGRRAAPPDLPEPARAGNVGTKGDER
jgi:hypothetical protein